jgi:hypothetical protein
VAVPAPVLTVVPGSVTRTYSNPTPAVALTDTEAPPSPAPVPPQGRDFKADGTIVIQTTGTTAAASYPVDLAPGARSMTVTCTNSSGAATSSAVTLTVTDNIATGLDTGYGANTAVAYRTLTDVPGKTRLDPNTLPDEWQDPTIATPGLPTAQGLIKARTRGSSV